MNKIFLLGNLTKDPEIRYTQSGTAWARAGIGVSRKVKNQDGKYDSDFFNLVAWGKTAEFCGKYLKKGSRIFVEGRLQNNNYEKDGVKHYGNDVVVDSVEFAESKNNSQKNNGDFDGEPVPDDDMPF